MQKFSLTQHKHKVSYIFKFLPDKCWVCTYPNSASQHTHTKNLRQLSTSANHIYAYYEHAHYKLSNTVSKAHRHLSHTCLIYVGSDSVKNSDIACFVFAPFCWSCRFVNYSKGVRFMHNELTTWPQMRLRRTVKNKIRILTHGSTLCTRRTDWTYSYHIFLIACTVKFLH